MPGRSAIKGRWENMGGCEILFGKVIYLHNLDNHIQAANVNPEEDFKFVEISYHHTKKAWWHIRFQENTVKPVIQKFMDEGKTVIKGWGNSLVISPNSKAFPYNSYSYELFSSVGDALKIRKFDSRPFPQGTFEEFNENYISGETRIYRIIKVVSAN